MNPPRHGAMIAGKRGQIFFGDSSNLDRIDDDWWDRCTADASCIVATGCVHEHIQRAPACTGCAAAAVAAVNDGKHPICWPCRRAGCEDCHVIVAIEQPRAVTA